MSKSECPSVLIIAKSLGLKTENTLASVLIWQWLKFTGILDIHIEQHEVTQLNGMNRHYPSFPKVTSPVLVGIFVIYPILKVVWQKILEF